MSEHRAPIHKSLKQPRAVCICFNLIVDLHFLHCIAFAIVTVRRSLNRAIFTHGIDLCCQHSTFVARKKRGTCKTNNNNNGNAKTTMQSKAKKTCLTESQTSERKCDMNLLRRHCRLTDMWHQIICDSNVRMAIGEHDSCH